LEKTNVLDAIYHLSYGKQPVAVQEYQARWEFFVIECRIHKDKKRQLSRL
jgi:hypothetical protein